MLEICVYIAHSTIPSPTPHNQHSDASSSSAASAFFPPLPHLTLATTPTFSVGRRPTVDAWMARCFGLLREGADGEGVIGEVVEGGHPLGTDVGR